MAFIYDRWSPIGQGSYMKFPSSGDDRVPSKDHNPSTHIQLGQPANEHGYHQDQLIPPCTVWKKSSNPPTGRSLIGWGSYIIEPAPPGDDSIPSPVQRSFYISKS